MCRNEIYTFKAIHKFIWKKLNKSNKKVLKFNSLKHIGQHYYKVIRKNVIGCNNNILDHYIKIICEKQSIECNDIHLALCEILRIDKVPKSIYHTLKTEYHNVFCKQKKLVYKKVDDKVDQLKKERAKLRKEEKDIIKKSNQNKTYVKDISTYEIALNKNLRRGNEIRTQIEMINYIVNYTENQLNEFSNTTNKKATLNKLKSIAISKSNSIYTQDDIDSIFMHYKNTLDITSNQLNNIMSIFFTVKFYSKYKDITEEYRQKAMVAQIHGNEQQVYECYKEQIDNLPKHNEMQKLKNENDGEYLAYLYKYIDETHIIDKIYNFLDECSILKDIQPLLVNTIIQFTEEQYQSFGHSMPVLIEGIFNNYLHISKIYDYMSNLNLSKNPDLQQKIDYIDNSDTNIYTEAVIYFKYYFNNLIRNTIAHGRYTRMCNTVEKQKIFACELLLDLNYLLILFDEASEYGMYNNVFDGYKQLLENSPDSVNACLLNDLLGKRTYLGFSYIYHCNPRQFTFWLFNPYYESNVCRGSLLTTLYSLRDIFKSKVFWQYVQSELDDSFNKRDILQKADTFKNYISSLFPLITSNDTKECLKSIHKQL